MIGNSAVAGIEPTISAIGERIRLKRGLSLAASATGTVHASEIAYARIILSVEATIAAGISRTSGGHGCESVLISAISPRPIAHEKKIAIEVITTILKIAAARLLCSGERISRRGTACVIRPIRRSGGTRTLRHARLIAGAKADST